MNINNEGKRVLLFYNPNSGNGYFSNNLDAIIRKFQAERLVTIPIRADIEGTIDLFLANMEQDMYRQVVVAGGDGTINVCVNSMIKNNIHLPLAIFPAGTANDFAYHLGLPGDIESMIDVALGGEYTYSDVGKVNDRYFINVAAIGALVDISQKTDPDLKNILGMFSYYMRGFQELHNFSPVPVRIESDEFTDDLEIFFMLVMNGRSAGGFKKLSPFSDINDGLLDVIIFKKMPIYEVGPLFFNTLHGKHQESKNVIYFQTNKLRISSDREIGTDVDGEKGADFPLEFSVLEKRFRINIPGNNAKQEKGML